jgi:hypothetical protein
VIERFPINLDPDRHLREIDRRAAPVGYLDASIRGRVRREDDRVARLRRREAERHHAHHRREDNRHAHEERDADEG